MSRRPFIPVRLGLTEDRLYPIDSNSQGIRIPIRVLFPLGSSDQSSCNEGGSIGMSIEYVEAGRLDQLRGLTRYKHPRYLNLGVSAREQLRRRGSF